MHNRRKTLTIYTVFQAVSILAITFVACGCAGKDMKSTLESSAIVSAMVPVGISYTVAATGHAAYQDSSIASGLPSTLYAIEVTRDQLIREAGKHGWKFHEPWMYIGSNDGYNYLALYPFLGFQTIYRIKEAEFHVADPFELTSLYWTWRELPDLEGTPLGRRKMARPLDQHDLRAVLQQRTALTAGRNPSLKIEDTDSRRYVLDPKAPIKLLGGKNRDVAQYTAALWWLDVYNPELRLEPQRKGDAPSTQQYAMPLEALRKSF